MKTLIDVQKPKKLKVKSISGGRGVLRHLAQLGIGVGSIINVERHAPFSGPIMIEHEGSKFVIGLGIAAKILVEVIN
jgi:ferrous iron transport protein A